MYERVPRYLTKYRDINRFFHRPTLVRIGGGSGHLGTCPARGTLFMGLSTTRPLYSVPPHTLAFLLLCIRTLSFY